MSASNSDSGQGRLFRYSAIATIVGTAILLFQWLDPRSPNSPLSSAEKPVGLIAVPDSTKSLAPENDPGGMVGQSVPPSVPEGGSPVPLVRPPLVTEKPASNVYPDRVLFSLKNGEQKIFSHGDFSVSGDFTQIGDMVVPTLHLQAKGKEPEDHALLTAGGRFEVAVGSKEFVVSVLGVDASTQSFDLRVDLAE
ncbi:MAG: hypothetical protein ABJC13_18975 [Acidobacteriota bacterium]